MFVCLLVCCSVVCLLVCCFVLLDVQILTEDLGAEEMNNGLTCSIDFSALSINSRNLVDLDRKQKNNQREVI